MEWNIREASTVGGDHVLQLEVRDSGTSRAIDIEHTTFQQLRPLLGALIVILRQDVRYERVRGSTRDAVTARTDDRACSAIFAVRTSQ